MCTTMRAILFPGPFSGTCRSLFSTSHVPFRSILLNNSGGTGGSRNKSDKLVARNFLVKYSNNHAISCIIHSLSNRVYVRR